MSKHYVTGDSLIFEGKSYEPGDEIKGMDSEVAKQLVEDERLSTSKPKDTEPEGDEFDVTKAKKPELQAEAERLELDSEGTVDELRDRIQAAYDAGDGE